MNITDKASIWNAYVNGVVPDKADASWLIGRDLELNILKNCLNKMDEHGTSHFKLIEGDYGFGKTMLMTVFESIALQEGYVVSRMALGTHNNFSKPEIVYKDIMSNIKTKRLDNETDFESIFEQWLSSIKTTMASEKATEHIKKIIEELMEYNGTFASVLMSYIRGKIINDAEISSLALSWIVGDYNMSVDQKKKIGVRGNIDRYNAFDILQGFSKLVELMGYKGFVIVIDELEYIMRERQDIRNKAYTTLRHFIDEVGMNHWNRTMFLGAYTPDMLSDETKGFKSYEALYQRIYSGFDDRRTVNNSNDLTIIRLEEIPRDALLKLAKKLIEISDSGLDTTLMGQLALVEYAKRDMAAQRKTSIREFVKVVIHVIQVAKSNPNMPIFKVMNRG